jgi:hypothetical protein
MRASRRRLIAILVLAALACAGRVWAQTTAAVAPRVEVWGGVSGVLDAREARACSLASK